MIVHWKNMRCFLFQAYKLCMEDRLLLEANLRYDGSSRFADGVIVEDSRQFLQGGRI